MTKKAKQGCLIIPPDVFPWEHELRVARILAKAGHIIEFMPTTSIKTADILMDGVEYEIKSPLTSKPAKLERVIKRALKQSRNVIYDSSRIKSLRDDELYRFLAQKAKQQPQIRKLIFVTKRGRIIDIKS